MFCALDKSSQSTARRCEEVGDNSSNFDSNLIASPARNRSNADSNTQQWKSAALLSHFIGIVI